MSGTRCKQVRLVCVFAWALATHMPAAYAEPSAPVGQHLARRVVVTKPGPQLLSVDLELLAGAQTSLADLRLFDEQEREVSYLVVPPRTQEPTWREATVIRPIVAASNESGFEADLGQVQSIDRIRILGLVSPLMKRLRVEGSTDRHRYSSLVSDATLFDLPEDGLQRLELDFTAGEFRTIRVVWDDHNSSPVGLPRSVSVRLGESRVGAAALRASVPFESRPIRTAMSQWRIRLPARGLPITAVELDTKQEQLLRNARISESRLENGRLESHLLGTASLRRATRSGMVAADLRIPIERPEANELILTVDNGNNPPLIVDQVRVELLPQPDLYFEAVKAGTYIMRYGAKAATAPSYDLEAARESLATRQLARATWLGAAEQAGATAVAAHPAASRPAASHGSTLDPNRFAYFREIVGQVEGMASVRLDAAVHAHGRELVDVRILDAASRQVPYVVEHESEPLIIELAVQPTPSEPFASQLGSRYSLYRLQLPYAGLPASRLALTTEQRVFRREVSLHVEQARHPGKPPRLDEIARATWIQGDPNQLAMPLELVVPAANAAELLLAVEQGDNERLALKACSLRLPSHSLRYFQQRGEALRLYYGDPTLSAPSYDLALLTDELMAMPTQEVTLGPEQARAAESATTNRLSSWFWGVLVLTVLTLITLIARLIRKTETSDAGGSTKPSTGASGRG